MKNFFLVLFFLTACGAGAAAEAQTVPPSGGARCVEEGGKVSVYSKDSVTGKPQTYKSCTGLSGNVTCSWDAGYDEYGTQFEAGSISVNCDTGITDIHTKKNTSPSVVECQDGWLGTSIGFGCALAGFTVRVLAGITAMFTTLLQWSSAAFSFAIERTIINFKPWFDTVSDPITDAWTLFRDLANITIIGLFVFIAISIILGLQEYGQKKLIARVIVIAILINFSFLFTLIIVNTSNLFATTIYNAMPLEKKADGTPVKIGEQFTKNMKVYSYDDTRNLLMTQYNIQGFGSMFAYGAFAAIFALSATFVFLYGALLIFARAVMLAVILLPLSSLAFASYLAPSFEETGWKRWWHSLLQQSFMAPLMMLFVLISLSLSKKVGDSNYSALANFATSPSDTPTWDVAFGFIVIVGSLFAGMYIASQLAGGAARRFATIGTGSLVGAGAGISALAGRNTIGKAFAIRGHNKINEAKNLNKEIEAKRLRGEDVGHLEMKYQKLLRQGAFANAQSKRTFDLRNTPAGSLLQKTGVPKALSEGTKKNYADVAHKAAEDAAKEASKTALGKGDIETIAKERAKELHGDAEAQHKQASQEVQDARKAMRDAREESANARRAAEQHDQAVRAGEDEKRRLESIHASETNEAEKARLQTQINTVGERIQAARRSAASARTRATQMEQRANNRVQSANESLKDAREGLAEFNTTVSKSKETVASANLTHVGKTARENVGNAFQRALYKSTGIGDGFIRHEAEIAATSRAKIKDKAEAKAAIDKYNKADDHHGGSEKKEDHAGKTDH